MKRYALTTGLIFVALVCAGPAFGAATTTEGAHGQADRNGDGVVDRREFQLRMVDVFYLQDADKDGRLTRAELPGASAKVFTVADRNGDGALDMKEFLAARAQDFARADADGDGGLSVAEAASYE